jgi:hypothetical protein
MVATPVVSAPSKTKSGQHLKLSGAGFRAGSTVTIVFDTPRGKVVGSAVAQPNGTFKVSIVVPTAGPGKHRLQVVGTNASGQPTSLAAPVVVLAEAAAETSSTPSLVQPVLLTLSVVLPLATWLALEMLGWRHRRHDKQGPGA